ncbi:hypothetical protein BDK51DRAFT_29517, partial [Blyttiomyces helicus]
MVNPLYAPQEYRPKRFKNLFELLDAAVASDSPATLKRLHTSLARSKRSFAVLLDDERKQQGGLGAHDGKARADLEKGIGYVTVNGQQTRVNKPFCSIALILSDFLNISEEFALTLLLVSVNAILSRIDATLGDPAPVTHAQLESVQADENIIKKHAEKLSEQRKSLGAILVLLATQERLSSDETIAVLKNLRTADPSDAATVLLLCSFLANLDVKDPDIDRTRFVFTKQSCETMLSIIKEPWQAPLTVRAVVLLHLIHFLKRGQFHLRDSDDFKDPRATAETLARHWRSISGRDVYQYIMDFVIPFRKRVGATDVGAAAVVAAVGARELRLGGVAEGGNGNGQSPVVPASALPKDLHRRIIELVETFVDSLVISMRTN